VRIMVPDGYDDVARWLLVEAELGHLLRP
jgi:hypothetical protein